MDGASMSPAGRLAQAAAPARIARADLLPPIAACVSGFLFQFDLSALAAALPGIVTAPPPG
jgi:hypothetical protein